MKQDITSPKKIAKKARHIFNKEMKNEARALGREIGNYMKPKPEYIPMWLWLWGMGFFIKIKRPTKP